MKYFLLFFLLSPAYAGVEQLPEKKFEALAAELAPKVNLFHAVWEQDPQAEFYGGTSRDFLYWIKGKFKDAKTPAEAEKIAAKLRGMPVIDVRSFIIGDSDVDVVSKQGVHVNATDFGVRKFDTQPADIFDPKSEAGFNELHQGYAPAEKIRLGANGIVENPGLGEGAKEIYSGRITVHFASAEEFAATKYAKEGINHPVLLALRYIRLQAMEYFQAHGNGLPNLELLQGALDPESAKAVKKVIEEAMDGDLGPFLKKHKFKSWANNTIQKAFRSYTNPTAALELMKHFGVDRLVDRYAPEIEPINQYVFAKHRDPVAIAKNFKKAKVNPEDVYLDPRQVFSDGYFYHGTREDPAFRAILFQGALPSTKGTAGAGLYGVAVEKKKFSEDWGGRERLLKLPVRDDAKIIDITKGPGEKLWKAWKKPTDFEGFAEAYGADILHYPYEQTEAYVVKNSAVLGKANGVYREILPLDQLLEKVPAIKDPKKLISLIAVNGFTSAEVDMIVGKSSIPSDAFLQLLNTSTDDEVVKAVLRYFVKDDPELLAKMGKMVSDPVKLMHLLKFSGLHAKNAQPALLNSAVSTEEFLRLACTSPDEQFVRSILQFVVDYSPEKTVAMAKQIRDPARLLLVLNAAAPNRTDRFNALSQSPIAEEEFFKLLAKPGFTNGADEIYEHFIGNSQEKLNEAASYFDNHEHLFKLFERRNVSSKRGMEALKHSKISPHTLDLLAYKPWEASNPRTVVKYVLPSAIDEHRIYAVKVLLNSNQETMIGIARDVLTQPVWDSQVGLIPEIFRGLKSLEQSILIYLLAEQNFGERHPEIFRDIVQGAAEETKKTFIARYLNDQKAFPGAWQKRRDLFLDLLKGTGASRTEGPVAPQLLQALIQEKSLAERPEYFLEFLRHISKNEKFEHTRNELIAKCLTDPAGLYHGNSYFSELTKGHPEDPEALAKAWEKERKKPAVKERLKSYQDPPAKPLLGCPANFHALAS